MTTRFLKDFKTVNIFKFILVQFNNFIVFRGENVLVTGGSGLIGRHLIKLLIEKGANITSIFQIYIHTHKLKEIF